MKIKTRLLSWERWEFQQVPAVPEHRLVIAAGSSANPVHPPATTYQLLRVLCCLYPGVYDAHLLMLLEMDWGCSTPTVRTKNPDQMGSHYSTMEVTSGRWTGYL